MSNTVLLIFPVNSNGERVGGEPLRCRAGATSSRWDDDQRTSRRVPGPDGRAATAARSRQGQAGTEPNPRRPFGGGPARPSNFGRFGQGRTHRRDPYKAAGLVRIRRLESSRAHPEEPSERRALSAMARLGRVPGRLAPLVDPARGERQRNSRGDGHDHLLGVEAGCRLGSGG